jgi:hypothetical protein
VPLHSASIKWFLGLAAVSLLAALLAAPAAFAISANDDRADAVPVVAGEAVEFNNAGNSNAPGEPNTTGTGCTQTNSTVNRTGWFTVTGSGGPVTVTTAAEFPSGAVEDTILFVYPHGSDTYLACNDDAAPAGPGRSEATFATTSGQTYDVQVGTCCGKTETGKIKLGVRPYNDRSTFPTPLTAGVVLTDSNRLSTTNSGETLKCVKPNGSTVSYSHTIWYSFHAASAGHAIFQASGSTEPILSVYSGSTQIACNADAESSNPKSVVGVDLAAGDYLIQLGRNGSASAPEGSPVTVVTSFTASPSSGGGQPTGGGGATNPSPTTPSSTKTNSPGTTAKSPSVVSGRLAQKFSLVDGLTVAKKLKVSGAPAGAMVKLTCTGKNVGCPFVAKSFAVKSAKALDLLSAIGSAKLAPGAVLRVAISAPSYIGAVTEFDVREGKTPQVKSLCLPPGAKSPKACT